MYVNGVKSGHIIVDNALRNQVHVNGTNGVSEQKTNGGLDHVQENGIQNHVEVRKCMKTYWKLYAPTLQSMMLSHDAEFITENEQSELLSYLPDFEGMNVLELGAGIGRYSTKLAQVAGHVTAVDFMEEYTAQNKKTNSHFDNIKFLCADVTKLDFAAGAFDMVFSNWLMMYLTDNEVEALFSKILTWLKPSGHFFFRESCYHPSGNLKRSKNPTNYRTPLNYIDLLSTTRKNGELFSILFSKNVFTYVIYSGNPNQLCFLVQKQNESTQAEISCQEHSVSDILRLCALTELPCGKKFITNICDKLKLSSGQRVLHLFSGTGEVSFMLADKYNVFVHGVQDSHDLMQLSVINQDKQDINIKKKIQFEAGQLSIYSFIPESYDAILCFNPFAKIDLTTVFHCCKGSIKRGGTIFLCDYFSTEAMIEKPNNIKYFIPEGLKSSMESCGFSVQIESHDEIAMTMMKEMRCKMSNGKSSNGSAAWGKIVEMEDEISKGNIQWIAITATKL